MIVRWLPTMKSVNSSSANRSHRGEAVIQDVLQATHEELARVGYRALRIEDVAARANVNRTTIYRRWPTKVELVREALQTIFDETEQDPDTGSFRGDLLVVAADVLRFLASAKGRVLVRMIMAEGADEELRNIVSDVRREKEAKVEGIIERARARGEVRPIRAEIFMAHLLGGLQHRIFVLGIAPEAIDIEEHVELLLHGTTPLRS